MLEQPLRLAVGTHRKGTGKGCAMNVISWENGDVEITDFPSCSDEFLATLVQWVNDGYCTHTTDSSLCPPCSVDVLALGHRTVGTNGASAELWYEIASTLCNEYSASLKSGEDFNYIVRNLAKASEILADPATYDPNEVRGVIAQRCAGVIHEINDAIDMSLMEFTHLIIDRFNTLSNRVVEPEIAPEVVEAAYEKLLVKTIL